MSLDHYDSVNTTIIKFDERKIQLTPGQIAAVTITSTFVFYMTIMFLVCCGEYCKYAKGRNNRAEMRRRLRHSAAHTRSAHDHHPRGDANIEIGGDPSDAVTSNSPNFSDSSCTDRDYSDRRQSLNHASEPAVATEIVEVHFEDSLDNVNIQCIDGCEMGPVVTYQRDSVILPLLPRQCEDTLDTDGDILCDSVDSRSVFPLEADV